MEAFLLETLVSAGWRRSGTTYWTLDDALESGQKMLRRKLARRIRVLPVCVSLDAVAELPIAAHVDEQQGAPA